MCSCRPRITLWATVAANLTRRPKRVLAEYWSSWEHFNKISMNCFLSEFMWILSWNCFRLNKTQKMTIKATLPLWRPILCNYWLKNFKVTNRHSLTKQLQLWLKCSLNLLQSQLVFWLTISNTFSTKMVQLWPIRPKTMSSWLNVWWQCCLTQPVQRNSRLLFKLNLSRLCRFIKNSYLEHRLIWDF